MPNGTLSTSRSPKKKSPIPNHCMTNLPTLKEQEIAYDDAESHYMFPIDGSKEFYVTERCLREYSLQVIKACWKLLSEKAEEKDGLDYLQIFESDEYVQNLWFIEEPFTVAAMLESDY